MLKGREDLGREKSFEALLNEILYELANPDITKKLITRFMSS